MKNLIKFLPVLVLILSGCSSSKANANAPTKDYCRAEHYYQTIGTEIPLNEVLGNTYDKAEQLSPQTKTGQIMTGLQWLFGIVGPCAK